MRVDIVSIFPEYLTPLELSLAGKARKAGLLQVHVHDLRNWAGDPHRTVDDAPYGGGPGMVMSPVPWGLALDAILAGDSSAVTTPATTLVVPTPAGIRLDQALAERLALRDRLVIACGRYEGIDQRVVDHYRARDGVKVIEVSLGDYVLNGGEAAALVLVEAIARLLPGFVGNPGSIVQESHAIGDGPTLLEAPVYTRPPTWRGLDVPAVLTSGDHERVRAWRRQQAMRRTAAIRPDLLSPGAAPDAPTHTAAAHPGADGVDWLVPLPATAADAGELLTLTRCCWVAEAQQNDSLDIPPLREDLADVRASIEAWRTWVVRIGGRLVGSVRARRGVVEPAVWELGRLMVAPDLEGHGIGRFLLTFAEAAAPPDTTRLRLLTGAKSARNLRMYRRAGYRRVGTERGDHTIMVVRLERSRTPA